MEENKYKRLDKVIADRNRRMRPISKVTGYRGVKKDNREGRLPFVSSFRIKYKNNDVSIGLGSYNTPEEAYIARLKFIDSLK